MREPLPARSSCQSMEEERGVAARSSSARERMIQSMRLLASMRQTENMRSCCSTGRTCGGSAESKPAMRAIFAAKVLTGDDGVATGSQTVSDDAIGERDAKICF